MQSIQKHPNPVVQTSVLSILLVVVIASCSSGGTHEKTDAIDEKATEVPLPAEIQMSLLRGTTVNLANKVNASGDLVFTMMDTTEESYGLFRYNLFDQRLAQIATLSARPYDRYPQSQQAIIDVLLDDQMVGVFTEVQYSDGRDTRSDFIMSRYDLQTGQLLEQKEVERRSGDFVGKQRCVLPSWMPASGLPKVYMGDDKARMANDIGSDRYEGSVYQLDPRELRFNLTIDRLDYSNTSDASWLDHDVRQQIYSGPLDAVMEYSGGFQAADGRNPNPSWVGSLNVVLVNNDLYFMLNDVLLRLDMGTSRLEKVAEVEIGYNWKSAEDLRIDQRERFRYKHFTAPDGFFVGGGAPIPSNFMGCEGSYYRKLFLSGQKLFVTLDCKRLYEHDLSTGAGRTIVTDTSCADRGMLQYFDFFIGPNSFWEFVEPSTLTEYDMSGKQLRSFHVASDAWDATTDGSAQVMALEDRASKTVKLCLMHPVTREELSSAGSGYDAALSTDEEPEWRDDEAAGDSTLAPVDTEEP